MRKNIHKAKQFRVSLSFPIFLPKKKRVCNIYKMEVRLAVCHPNFKVKYE